MSKITLVKILFALKIAFGGEKSTKIFNKLLQNTTIIN